MEKRVKEENPMSYVDEIYERVVNQNPGENEFHQENKKRLP